MKQIHIMIEVDRAYFLQNQKIMTTYLLETLRITFLFLLYKRYFTLYDILSTFKLLGNILLHDNFEK